jgi:uncharacterized membrane protein
MTTETAQLLDSEGQQLAKLKQIVQDAVREEELMVDNLLHQPQELLTKGQSLSDQVAKFGGSWKFIILFSFIISGWILFNTLTASRTEFDPYPFILMNLVLSAVAALQAPVIMMSQNRQEEKDRKQGENDYLINLKAELEIRSLHQKIDLLLEEQIKVLFETQAKQLDLLQAIEARLARDGR